jgi:hypothetical protein
MLWLVTPNRLSRREQSLIGTWYNTTGSHTLVLEFYADRRLLLRSLDEEIGPGRYALDGTWKIKGETLICDERSTREVLLPIAIDPQGHNIAGTQLPRLRWVGTSSAKILGLNDQEFTLQAMDSTPRTWKRWEQPDGK